MATKLNVLLFVGSTVMIIMLAILVFVPNLISYTICISMADLTKLMGSMTSMSGTPQMSPGTQMTLPATVESNSRSTCDYKLSVSLGIWRCGMEWPGPQEGSWEGTYSSLGDDIKTGFALMTPTLEQMGAAKTLIGDKAGEALADLVGTVALRFEIQVVLALMFAIMAFLMALINIREKEGPMKPMANICAAMSHAIAATLLGVSLGAFAQQLHQMSLLGEVYTMIKITDQGYGFLVMGFAAVLVSVVLAVAHLLVLVYHLKKQEEPKSDVEYNLLSQNEESA